MHAEGYVFSCIAETQISFMLLHTRSVNLDASCAACSCTRARARSAAVTVAAVYQARRNNECKHSAHNNRVSRRTTAGAKSGTDNTFDQSKSMTALANSDTFVIDVINGMVSFMLPVRPYGLWVLRITIQFKSCQVMSASAMYVSMAVRSDTAVMQRHALMIQILGDSSVATACASAGGACTSAEGAAFGCIRAGLWHPRRCLWSHWAVSLHR